MSKKTNFNKEVFFKYYITSQAQNNSFHQYNACRLLRLIELENNQSKNVLFYDSLSILFAKKAGLKDSLFKSYYNYSIDLLGVNKTLSAQKIINEYTAHVTGQSTIKEESRLFFATGHLYHKLQKTDSAIYYFKKCLVQAIQVNDSMMMMNARLGMIDANFLTAKFDSVKKVYEIMDYFKSHDKGERVARCFYLIAFSFQCSGNINKAAEYYFKAREIHIKNNNFQNIGSMDMMVASIIMTQKKFDSSRLLLSQAEYYFRKTSYTAGLSALYTIFGMLYTYMGDADSSKTYMSKAKEINKNEESQVLKILNTGYTAVRASKFENNKVTDSLLKQASQLYNNFAPPDLLRYVSTKASVPKEILNFKAGKLIIPKGSYFDKSSEKASMIFINPYTGERHLYDSMISFRQNTENIKAEVQYGSQKLRVTNLNLKTSLNKEKQTNIQAKKKLTVKNITIVLAALVGLAFLIGFATQYRNHKNALKDNEHISLSKDELQHTRDNQLKKMYAHISAERKSSAESIPLHVLESRITAILTLNELLYAIDKKGVISLQSYLDKLCPAIASVFDPDNSVKVSVDTPVMLRRKETENAAMVINELLTNSYKYAFESGRRDTIEITSHQNKKQVSITVSDNGKGFDASLVNEGYGLDVVKGLIKQLNGSYSYEMANGTSFTFSFPFYKS